MFDAEDFKKNEKALKDSLMSLDKKELSKMVLELLEFLCEKGASHAKLRNELKESRQIVAGILIEKNELDGTKEIILDQKKLDAITEVSIECIEEDEGDKRQKTLRLNSYSLETVISEPTKTDETLSQSAAEELIELLSKVKTIGENMGKSDSN